MKGFLWKAHHALLKGSDKRFSFVFFSIYTYIYTNSHTHTHTHTHWLMLCVHTHTHRYFELHGTELRYFERDNSAIPNRIVNVSQVV